MDRSVKMVFLALVAVSMLLLTGCGTGFPNGLLYTNITIPLVVNGGDIDDGNYCEVTGVKVLGIIAVGDVSYETAMKKARGGSFGRIQRVEYFSKDFGGNGVFGIRIYGETKKSEAGQDKKDK